MHHTTTLPTIEAKRIASVTARLALLGIELRRALDGTGFVASRFGLERALPTLDAVELFTVKAVERVT